MARKREKESGMGGERVVGRREGSSNSFTNVSSIVAAMERAFQPLIFGLFLAMSLLGTEYCVESLNMCWNMASKKTTPTLRALI